MIEGLKLDFTAEELRTHLRNLSIHHDERRAFYERQAKALQDGGAEQTQYTGGDPIKNLKDKANEHERKSILFKIFADHLVDETYRLQENDLVRLEFLSRWL